MYWCNKTKQACNKIYKKKLFNGIKFPVGRLYEDIAVAHEILFNARKVILSEKFYIEGNIEGAQGERKFVYPFDELDTSFSKDDVVQICKEHQIDPRFIYDFVVQPNDAGFSNKDPDKNPLLQKPIIKFVYISN